MKMVSHDGDSSVGGAAVARWSYSLAAGLLADDVVFLFFDTRQGHHDLNRAES